MGLNLSTPLPKGSMASSRSCRARPAAATRPVSRPGATRLACGATTYLRGPAFSSHPPALTVLGKPQTPAREGAPSLDSPAGQFKRGVTLGPVHLRKASRAAFSPRAYLLDLDHRILAELVKGDQGLIDRQPRVSDQQRYRARPGAQADANVANRDDLGDRAKHLS